MQPDLTPGQKTNERFMPLETLRLRKKASTDRSLTLKYRACERMQRTRACHLL